MLAFMLEFILLMSSMTDSGFWEVAALSKYIRGLPYIVCLSAGICSLMFLSICVIDLFSG